MLIRTGVMAIGALFISFFHIVFPQSASSLVIEKARQTFLLDHTGEQWDITQARSIGFRPDGFEFGIGRNAFTPLDENNWTQSIKSVPQSLRVIGIAEGKEAQAYSVSKLTRHEIANTAIESEPITVGY